MNITTLLFTSLLSSLPTTPVLPDAEATVEASAQPKEVSLSALTASMPSPTYRQTDPAPTHSDWYWEIGFQTVTTTSSDGPGEEIDFNEGLAVPLLIGKRFSSESNEQLGFAVELEGLYTNQESENENFFSAVRDVTGTSVLVNGVVDYSLSPKFGVYAGAGLGVSWLSISKDDDLLQFDDEDGPFLTWQAKAGVLYQATDTLGIDIGYRFLNIDDVELDNTNGNADFELQTEQHMLGLGFRFDI